MSNHRPPKMSIDFANLPTDPKERHEVLVDLFGEYMFWVRGQTLDRVRHLIHSDEERGKIGNLFRGVFDDVAKLSDVDKETAVRLADASISNFAGLFMTMIAGQGFDDPMGPKHVFRFRLDMEVCDAETGNVVFEETINRGGRKFFPEYWGRWLNKFLSK